MWDSPVGLTPGHPGHRVRMVREDVDVEVVESDADIFAFVHATYELLNAGPDLTMKVGFPGETYDLDEWREQPVVDRLGPYWAKFRPGTIADFRAWADDEPLDVAWESPVTSGDGPLWRAWLVWQMTFPSQRPVRVRVSYRQQLDVPLVPPDPARAPDPPRPPSDTPVLYVLRTGALWDGTIGEAGITIRATGGGVLLGGPELQFSPLVPGGEARTTPPREAFLGAAQAAERAPDRLVWRLREFEPAWDIGSTYVSSRVWDSLSRVEAAIQAGTADETDYLLGVELARELVGSGYRRPLVLVQRYAAALRDWARRAVALGPDDPAAWEALGDVEWGRAEGFMELTCWPVAAAEAFERAAALGSPTASDKRERLERDADYSRDSWRQHYGDDSLEAARCPEGDMLGVDELSRDSSFAERAIRSALQGWSDALDRGGSPAPLSHHFADTALAQVTGQVEALRDRGAHRRAVLRSLAVHDVAVPAADRAVVVTGEGWDERLVEADGRVVELGRREVSGRYELRLREGTWKVVAVSSGAVPAAYQVPRE
jgi:hypothetical protein